MQIHLSDIADSEGKKIQITSELELKKISFQLGEFPILQKSPVELTIINTGDRVLELEGQGNVTVGIPCDRCLEEVSVEIPYSIERKLDMKQSDSLAAKFTITGKTITAFIAHCSHSCSSFLSIL